MDGDDIFVMLVFFFVHVLYRHRTGNAVRFAGVLLVPCGEIPYAPQPIFIPPGKHRRYDKRLRALNGIIDAVAPHERSSPRILGKLRECDGGDFVVSYGYCRRRRHFSYRTVNAVR